MKEICLDGAEMPDKAAAHAYLKLKLDLPDYYGNNLDALWDCLSTDLSPKRIVITRPEMIADNLGSYGESLIELFLEAARDRDNILVEIENPAEQFLPQRKRKIRDRSNSET